MERRVRHVEIKVEAVALDWKGEPVIVLREVEGPRAVFIWVGVMEVSAVSLPLEKQVPPRPLTHDLIANLLEELQVEVARVVISDMRDVTYYATLELESAGTLPVGLPPCGRPRRRPPHRRPQSSSKPTCSIAWGRWAQSEITIVNPGEPTVH